LHDTVLDAISGVNLSVDQQLPVHEAAFAPVLRLQETELAKQREEIDRLTGKLEVAQRVGQLKAGTGSVQALVASAVKDLEAKNRELADAANAATQKAAVEGVAAARAALAEQGKQQQQVVADAFEAGGGLEAADRLRSDDDSVYINS